MSPSSTGDSPDGVMGIASRVYSAPSRDNFIIDISATQLNAMPINGSMLKSPGNNPKLQRTSSFSREGILGAAQKARHLSQSSESLTNGTQKQSVSDEESNPLKRRNADTTVDYPRRRATIAVGHHRYIFMALLTISSVRYAGPGNPDATAPNQSASFVPNLVPTVFTASLVSNSTLAIS